MKYNSSKKLFLLATLTLILVVVLPLAINIAFYKPTKINAFIAASIYKTPANISFTDDNFYQCVVDVYNEKNGTSVAYTETLTDEQLKSITSLSRSNKNIASSNGLQKLTSLTQLSVSNNQLTSLDLSKHPSLTFGIYNNRLTSLYLSRKVITFVLEFSESLNVDDTSRTINKLKEKTTVSDILSNIDTDGTVTIKNNKDEVLTNNDMIDTGSKLIIDRLGYIGIEYTLIVSGDVNGDGKVNIADVVKIDDHTLDKSIEIWR